MLKSNVDDAVELPVDIAFEAWVDHIFEHDDPGWHWELDSPYWDSERNPALAVDHIQRLFSSPENLIGRFTADQIGSGLNYLINSSCSSTMFAVIEPPVPIELRVRCVHSFADLYARLFVKICVPHLHAGKRGTDPRDSAADYVCYMFWDVIPFFARTKNPLTRTEPSVKNYWDDHLQIEQACLDVMAKTLQLDHIACQEGALHGLGHWATDYPDRVRPVIDRFLTKPGLDPDLVSYAKYARRGQVQ